jgi:hypothetical protein
MTLNQQNYLFFLTYLLIFAENSKTHYCYPIFKQLLDFKTKFRPLGDCEKSGVR